MKNKKEQADAAFIKEYLEQAYKEQELPEALSEKNISAIVSGRKQKRPVKLLARRAIASVIAACIAIFCIRVYDYAVFSPSLPMSEENGGIVYASSYGEIGGIIRDYAKRQKVESFLYSITNEVAGSLPADNIEDAALAGTSENNYIPGDVQHSDTNLRVDGVDEADIIKTDGKNIYIVKGIEIIIIEIKQDGELELLSNIDVRRSEDIKDAYVNGFYLYGDYLIASCCENIYTDDYCREQSGVLIFDISDKAKPELVRVLLQDGVNVSSRIVNGSLIYISSYLVNFNSSLSDEELIPAVYNGTQAERELLQPSDIAFVNPQAADSFLIISKLKLDDLQASPETLALFGGGAGSYCTDNTLYIASCGFYGRTSSIEMQSDSLERKTTVMSFDISGEKPVFKAKGSFNGSLLNSFSLDEYKGYLRIAASTAGANALYVMNDGLEIIGSLKDIAPGEQIKSVRFMGNTAYIVTFLQVDPLFVINLENPESPEITGELKIPGFSEYLHPVGENLLIGIGFSGTQEGLDNGAKISLFDVSNPAAPVERDTVILENTRINTDYKAFVSVKQDGSFIIPVDSYDFSTEDDGGTAIVTHHMRSGSLRFKVENGKIVRIKDYFDVSSSTNVYRVLYAGNVVYNMNFSIEISAFDMQSGAKLFSGSF